MTDIPADELREQILAILWSQSVDDRMPLDVLNQKVTGIHKLIAAHERALLDSLLEQDIDPFKAYEDDIRVVPVSVIQAKLNILLPSGGVEG